MVYKMWHFSVGSCPDIPTLPSNVVANCSGNYSDSVTCELICRDGYSFNGTIVTYSLTCSKLMKYAWDMETLNSLPPCRSKYYQHYIYIYCVTKLASQYNGLCYCALCCLDIRTLTICTEHILTQINNSCRISVMYVPSLHWCDLALR